MFFKSTSVLSPKKVLATLGIAQLHLTWHLCAKQMLQSEWWCPKVHFKTLISISEYVSFCLCCLGQRSGQVNTSQPQTRMRHSSWAQEMCNSEEPIH